MSRLTDLIAQAKSKDPLMGADLEREFKALSSRRSFGLNFERHRPETVELPQRPVRKGDKVHVLPPRGETSKGDQRIWTVKRFETVGAQKIAHLVERDALEPEIKQVDVSDLVVVAEFRDKIYPGLVSSGKVENGGDKPFHSVINGENYHALKALTFTHRGKVDAIYIDPPYNSGAKDWKYNNDYVESEDLYRHSKWLAFMERRLKLAKQLLNPQASALILSIDEKEYLRIGLLLEQVFPEAKIQMVSSLINAKGIIRANEFSRTNEFIYFVFIGEQEICPEITTDKSKKVRWASLRRTDLESARGTKKGGPEQFYPIYVDKKTSKIVSIGTPLKPEDDYKLVPKMENCDTIFPIREKGNIEMNWGLTVSTLKERLDNGYVKAVRSGKTKVKTTIYYLTSGPIDDIEKGSLLITGHGEDGSVELAYAEGKATMPTTQWNRDSHNSQSHGSNLIKALLPNRTFPFPKSLYAVEDALRMIVKNNTNATVLDFFAGSGTTAHALMRLNRQDGGSRQCISVTNNEVGPDEQKELRARGFRPGDADWEKLGICDYITKPRVQAAITGINSDGEEVSGEYNSGNYKFIDEFPLKEGFRENAEFFTLTYETPLSISHNLAFSKVAPLLWLRAGSQGRRIDEIPPKGWDVCETYGVLMDLDKAKAFSSEVTQNEKVRIAYIVTNDDRRFQSVVRNLPKSVEAVRLYESYLNNFQFTNGE
ncbi:site-specific DNA-methyltransferase [Photobacterium leiognathi]|uniref:site-specific DNA-methyltransferase n=1 Tax=Photobacterium leiognathi TaxID=553611 RepID=UPI001EDF5E0D|nr:site-specific DNA-methyltransferase [Photobacterium leiognathi]